MAGTDFSLHPQLAADTFEIGDLSLSRLLLSKDSTYPWLILVPRRGGAGDIVDLVEKDRQLLMQEIARVGEALKIKTRCDRLNVAALGNVVPQLHIHVIARFRGDAAWPKPVWGQMPPVPYPADEASCLIDNFRDLLFKPQPHVL